MVVECRRQRTAASARDETDQPVTAQMVEAG